MGVYGFRTINSEIVFNPLITGKYIVSKNRKYLRFLTIGNFFEIICLIGTDDMVDDIKNVINLAIFGTTAIGLTIISWYMIRPKQTEPVEYHRNPPGLFEVSRSNNFNYTDTTGNDHTSNDLPFAGFIPTTVNHENVSISIV